jgi:hypothetical protein
MVNPMCVQVAVIPGIITLFQYILSLALYPFPFSTFQFTPYYYKGNITFDFPENFDKFNIS